MKRTRTATMVALMLLISLFAGCAAPAATAVPPTSTSTPPTATAVPPTATPVPATPTVAAPVLQITGPGGSKSLSLADIKALPATEGQAGIKSSTGKITLPELYKGVSLKDLMAALGGFDASTGVNVVAKDGYGITFSYDQVMNGTFIAYDPSTALEVKSLGEEWTLHLEGAITEEMDRATFE
jgi:hypothetical protein